MSSKSGIDETLIRSPMSVRSAPYLCPMDLLRRSRIGKLASSLERAYEGTLYDWAPLPLRKLLLQRFVRAYTANQAEVLAAWRRQRGMAPSPAQPRNPALYPLQARPPARLGHTEASEHRRAA